MTSSKGRIPSDRANTRLGARIGPRIAQVTSRAMSDHLRRSAHTRAKIGTEAALGVFRTMAAEKHNHVTPLLGLYLGGEHTPPELEKTLRFMAHGRGELAEIMTAKVSVIIAIA